jgi:hypothetical protein
VRLLCYIQHYLHRRICVVVMPRIEKINKRDMVADFGSIISCQSLQGFPPKPLFPISELGFRIRYSLTNL